MNFENKALNKAIYFVNALGALVLIVIAIKGASSLAAVAFVPLLLTPSAAFALLPKQAKNIAALSFALIGSITSAVIGSQVMYNELFVDTASRTPLKFFLAPFWQAVVYCATIIFVLGWNRMIKSKGNPDG